MFKNLKIGKPYLFETKKGSRIGFVCAIKRRAFSGKHYIEISPFESLGGIVEEVTFDSVKKAHEIEVNQDSIKS